MKDLEFIVSVFQSAPAFAMFRLFVVQLTSQAEDGDQAAATLLSIVAKFAALLRAGIPDWAKEDLS